MRKITTFLSMLAFSGLCLTANAADFYLYELPAGTGSVTNNTYAVSASFVTLEGATQFKLGANPSCTVTMPDGSTKTFTEAWLGYPGDKYEEIEESNYVTLEFSIWNEDFTTTPGRYEIEIPAGIVVDGDSQNLPTDCYFNIVNVALDQDDAIISEEPGTYSPSELSEILISWEGYPLQSRSWMLQVTAEKVVESDVPGEPGISPLADNDNIIDITPYVGLDYMTGAIKLDLSRLEDGDWIIDIPASMFYGTTEGSDNKETYCNKGIQLRYTIETSYPSMSIYKITSGTDYYWLAGGLYYMEVSFSNQKITINEGVTPTVTINGEEYDANARVDYSSYQNSYTLSINYLDVIDELDDPAGEYVVTIPEGLVSNPDGESNPEISHTFYAVERTTNFIVTPNGSKLSYNSPIPLVTTDELKNLTITFEGFENVAINNKDILSITVSYGENNWGNYENNYELDASYVKIEGNVVKLNLPEILDTQYYITIPTTYFIIDENYSTSTIGLEYEVWNGLKYAEVLSQPEELSGPYLAPLMLTWNYQEIEAGEELENILISWGYPEFAEFGNPGGFISLPEGAAKLVYIPEQGEGGEVSPLADGAQVPNCLYVDLSSLKVQEANNMKIIIPQNCVKNAAGEINPEQTFEFNMYNYLNGTIECEETENPGVFYITWSGDYQEFYTNDYTAGSPILIGGDVRMNLTYTWGEPGPGEWSFASDYSEGTYYVLVNVNDLELEAGNYDIIFPQGFFMFSVPVGEDEWGVVTESSINPEVSVSINVAADGSITTGIDSINNMNDGIYRVYNLMGMKVLESKDASSIRNLNSGLYIVNGKKVFIRK